MPWVVRPRWALWSLPRWVGGVRGLGARSQTRIRSLSGGRPEPVSTWGRDRWGSGQGGGTL